MSEYQQAYSRLHHYPAGRSITIPLTLSVAPDTHVDLLGKLDTGSTFCIFERAYADLLGLDLTAGLAQSIATVTGTFNAYGHTVTLAVFDYEWEAVVYFAELESFAVNVLGRIGFLDHLRVGLVDYDQLLYCGLYEES